MADCCNPARAYMHQSKTFTVALCCTVLCCTVRHANYLVGVEHTPEQVLSEGKRPEYLRRREGGVQEKADPCGPQDSRQKGGEQ